MDSIQTFYDTLASQYDKLFEDWQATTKEQALFLDKLFKDNGYDETLKTSKFECAYRAVLREELTALLIENGCDSVGWKLPEETGFYQPIVIAKKHK